MPKAKPAKRVAKNTSPAKVSKKLSVGKAPVRATKKTDDNKKVVLKLSLACGDHKPEGFKGVDIVKTKSSDYVFDLLKFPWEQIKDNSVDEIECSNFVEHIPHGGSYNDPFFQFFDEIYRILKPAEFDPNNPNIPIKGFATIVCPYYSSMRAWQDPTHHRAISEASFLYVNKKWREDNALSHYPIGCDFDFTYGYSVAPEWQNRNEETRNFAIRNYINAVFDISVTLVKRT